MNKIILLFSTIFSFIVTSCDNDTVNSIHYLDNKLIEGTWIDFTISADGSYTVDSTVYIFKDNRATYRFYAYVRGLDTLKLGEDTYLGTYAINDSTIFYSIHFERNQIYKLKKNNNDSLFLRYPAETISWEGLKKLKE